MEPTSSEKHVDHFMTDSIINRIIEPGYIPDVSLMAMAGQPAATGVYQGPYLEILEQPKQRGFRFRYPCEGPSHGGLPGAFSERGKKSYPSVQLCNYQGPARIVVSLVTADDPPMPHAHSLIGKSIVNGMLTVQIGPEQGMTASFPNLGIEHVTKRNVTKVLMDRYIRDQALHTATVNALTSDPQGASGGSANLLPNNFNGNDFDRKAAAAVAGEEAKKMRQIAEARAKAMNLSVVRLCFQAYLPDEKGNFTKPLDPAISNQVYDSKAPAAGALKICRMDKNSGCVTGGDEIYLLCDKVQREDIEVHFFEYDKNEGKLIWEEKGIFAPSDVHRQFAIVFKTPPYFNIAMEQPAQVMIELRRKSDGETSDPVQFTYHPQMFDKEQIGAKRRKKIPHFADYFSGGGGGGGPGGAAGGSGAGGAGGAGGFNFASFQGLFGMGFGQFQQFGGSGTSGGTTQSLQGAKVESEAAKNESGKAAMLNLAFALAERTSSAIRDYAVTGDVRYLLAVQRQLTAVQDDSGDTALHLSIINIQPDVTDSLLAVMAGLPDALVNEFNYLRQTPLHLAAITKQPHTIEMLLKAKADPTLRDRHGNTAAHVACSHGDVASLKVLVNREIRRERGALPELNIQNYNGFTPVHLAVLSGNKALLKILNSAGANMDVQDGTTGRTPLHHAVETDNLAVAGFLILESGCDIDIQTYDGNSPLHVAAGLGLKGQTALLVAAGADTTLENNEEDTPFNLANVAEVQEILDEDVEVESNLEESDDNEIDWTGTLGDGDLEKLDNFTRLQISTKLDPVHPDGADWKKLAQKLGLGVLTEPISLSARPTMQVLAQYEGAGGSMATLQSVVQDMGRDDVLEILELAKQKCAPAENSAGLGSRDCDSGIDSQSASAGVSHEDTILLADSARKASRNSPTYPPGMTGLDARRRGQRIHQIKHPYVH